MNGRRAKAIRKLQKQSMDKQNTPVNYSFEQLSTLINLLQQLTGEKPTELFLTESFYTWYVQECQKHADVLGLNLGFKDDTPMFSGVKLVKREKKVDIEVAK